MNFRAFWHHKERQREVTPEPNTASLHSRGAKIRWRRSVFASCLLVKSEVSHSPFLSADSIARLFLLIQRLFVYYLHQSFCPRLRLFLLIWRNSWLTSQGKTGPLIQRWNRCNRSVVISEGAVRLKFGQKLITVTLESSRQEARETIHWPRRGCKSDPFISFVLI